MKTPALGDVKTNRSGSGLGDDLLDEFYVEMSKLIEDIHMEISDYTPQFFHSYHFLRFNAVKIFQNFIGDVRALVDVAKAMDVNVQGTLFDDE